VDEERDLRLPAPDAVSKSVVDDLTDQDVTMRELRILRERQRREAARGCLLALVLEGAAVLAGVGWVLFRALGWPAGQRACEFAFLAFTISGVLVAFYLLIVQNLPKHRQLREEAEAIERERAEDEADARDEAQS
jgi:uncharacterized membrane protein